MAWPCALLGRNIFYLGSFATGLANLSARLYIGVAAIYESLKSIITGADRNQLVLEPT
jgi:hypothetical protein